MREVRGLLPKRALGVAAAATAAFALCATSANAALTLRDSDGAKLATFKTVACKTAKGKGFTGTSTAGTWKLTIRIQPFTGFHPYRLRYGPAGKAKFFARSGETTYSNTVEPPDSGLPETAEGGDLAFPGGSDKIGVAFGTAFQAGNTLEYASLFGLAACN